MFIKVNLPIIWFVLSMISGIYLRLGVSFWICLVCFIYAIFSCVYLAVNKFYKMSIGVIIAFIIGFVNTGNAYSPPELSPNELEFKTWEATIYETGYSQAGNQKIYVDIERENKSDLKVYLLWTGEEHYFAGDVIRFTGEIEEFNVAKQKGDFNEKMYFSSLQLDYKCFPETIEKIDFVNNFHAMKYNLKEEIFDIVDLLFVGNEVGVLKTLLTGIDDYIPKDLNDVFVRSGISHILCISGLHISILAMMVDFVLKKWFRLNGTHSSIITAVFSVGLILFIGFTPALCRATIMTLFALGGRIFFRKYVWTNILAIAGGAILLVSPLDLWGVSFQLSFMTIVGINICTTIINKHSNKLTNLHMYFAVSVYSALFSFPIIAYYFYNISVIGIFLNAIIVPICGLLLISCILACVFSLFLMPVAECIAWITKIVFTYIETIATMGADITQGYILVGSQSILSIVIYYALIICGSFYKNEMKNKVLIVTLMTALFISIYGNELIFKKNTIAFLDVGQGDSTVITTYDKKAVIIDGGGVFGKEAGENTGVTVVKPYLDYMGIDEVESVFITHFDRDHCLGIIELCDVITVNKIYVSLYPFDNLDYWYDLKEVAERNNIPIYTVSAGDEFNWGVYGDFACLSPQEGIYYADGDDNHGSIVLKYTYGGVSTLLMGDATSEDENIILDKGYDVQSDILKFGHHGSGYSSSAEFLQAVNPAIGIVSCGYNNTYNHPHPDLFQRGSWIDVYRTDTMGGVYLEINPSGEFKIQGTKNVNSVYDRLLNV